MTDDAQLIDQTLSGDSASFGELVLRYQNRLYNTMAHFVGCREEAEDVVQDAFVQAFVKLETFQGTSAFYTWLYRIAFNVAISRQRRKRPASSIEQTRDRTGGEPVDPGEQPEQQLQRQEKVEQVHEALGNLSDEHRSILVLRELEGCAYESISEILDLPLGTVRSRLHRARLQLKVELQEVLQGETN